MSLHSRREIDRPGAEDRLAETAWLADDPRPLDWNGPASRLFTPFPSSDLQRPIVELFERVARRQPGRIAIRDGATVLTFGQLWDGASGLAVTLERETRPGDLIGLALPAGPMFPLAMLACLASGRPFLALDTQAPAAWLGSAIDDARPSLIVTLADGRPVITAPGRARVIRLAEVPAAAPAGWRPAPAGVDAAACVLFTSGSTGRPKSIVNSQRNLLQRVAQSINAAHVNPDDRLLTLAPPSTIVGVRDVMTALLAGASIHLLDPRGAGARDILTVVEAESSTILFAFPGLLRSIVDAHRAPAEASLRLVRVGGDTTLWSDVDAVRAWLAPAAAIQVVYAATEAPMTQWFVDEACRGEDTRVPIGFPLPGNRLALVDDGGRPVRPGEVGELVVESPYVSLGRWTAGGVADGASRSGSRPGSRVFRTGDLVRQRPDGLLERVGRKDRQVKIRGARVDLDGVEALLRGHPAVRDVAAFARPGVGGTATLVAYVTARDGAPVSLVNELKRRRRSAPPPMRPARFYLVPSIPRLANSKLDVPALAALDQAAVRAECAGPAVDDVPAGIAGDEVTRSVARAWQRVLASPVRAADDDFFDSGGDSLNAVTFVLALEEALGIEIPLVLINEAPRFDQLCDALRERRVPRSSPLLTLKPGDGHPPVFMIHGLGGNVVEMLPAARRVRYAGAVIGIRARGTVRGEAPHTSVEAMATDYLAAIRKRQPRGPYYLCGYSSGGLVAFEIARRLSAAGEDVRLVGLFDTRMSVAHWPLRAWLAIAGRRAAVLGAALRAPLRTWPVRSRRFATRLRGKFGAAPARAIRVTVSALIASARYRPGFYRGPLTLFSPAEREPGLPCFESFWRAHALTVVAVETPGTHATMLSAQHAEAAAARLSRYLPRAQTAG
jgi:non-ribosomal peptide synthetase component F/thioesterase domain-containing protein/acyl carrier protein